METASPLTSAHVQAAKSLPFPPRLGTCTLQGVQPQAGTPVPPSRRGWLAGVAEATDPSDGDAAGALRGRPSAARPRTEEPFVLRAGAGCLSAAGAVYISGWPRSPPRGHAHGAPSPAAPRVPRCHPGFAGEGGDRSGCARAESQPHPAPHPAPSAHPAPLPAAALLRAGSVPADPLSLLPSLKLGGPPAPRDIPASQSDTPGGKDWSQGTAGLSTHHLPRCG